MDKKTVIIIVIVLVVICFCCAVVTGAGAYFIITSTQPAVDVGESFMQSLKIDDYQSAFTLLTPNTQRDVSGPLNLGRIVNEQDLIPQEWSINSRSASGKNTTIKGKMTTRSETDIDFVIELHKINNQWLINYFGLP